MVCSRIHLGVGFFLNLELKKRYFIFFGFFFGILSILYGLTASNKKEIFISENEISSLISSWTNQMGRQPNNDEVTRIINNLINEEVLYREALVLGLDKDDIIIKRRLAQKINFLKSGQFSFNQSEKELMSYYQKNRDNYKEVIKYSFSHIFFSKDNDGANRANLFFQDQNGNLDNLSGDPYLLGNNFFDRTLSQIDTDFGYNFSKNFLNKEINKWYGPYESTHGNHIIIIKNIVPENVLEFEEIKEEVVKNYIQKEKLIEMNKYISSLKDKYKITIQNYEN